MAYSASDIPPVMEQTTQDATSNLQSTNPALEKLLESRKNKLVVTSPQISDIHEKTDRVEKNKVANEKEFYTKRGKYYPKGNLYHVHYTTDLEVYYMSGGEHNPKTILLFKKSIFDSDFDYYNSLNKQERVSLKSTIKIPNEQDYNRGRVVRYFAKRSNDDSSSVFEISVDDFDTSPLYQYTSLTWYIKGDKEKVLSANKKQILIASQEISNIGKLLPDFQYYRSEDTANQKQSVLDRLGISSEQSESQQETTTTPKNNTQQSAPTGPPPGVTTGGAGGVY